MGLALPWILLVWGGVIVAGGIVLIRLRRNYQRKHHHGAVPVAHSSRLTTLPSYLRIERRYRWLARGLSLSGIVILVAAIALSARPVALSLEQSDLHNRDIMLCLDVSGSTLPLNTQLLQSFRKLVDRFKGERIGLTVFDSVANNLFPLTDDYDFVKDQLDTIIKESETGYSATLRNGTWESGKGSSLVGDGLASCIMRFDNLDIVRSRSVILATDNMANGEQIINLPQAGVLAREKSVRVYGVNPFDFTTGRTDGSGVSSFDQDAIEFREVTLSTRGGYYTVDYDKSGDAALIRAIVDKISAQEATRFRGAPRLVQTDIPTVFIIAAGAAIAIWLVAAWRLRL